MRSLAYLLFLLFAFSSCQKELSEENTLPVDTGGSQSGTAQFTLAGAPGSCTLPVISGNYVSGSPLNSSNTVELIVNVTTPGTYVISSNLSNGIRFSGSGAFTAAGPAIITLTGSGTPSAAMSSTYSPGTSGCNFIINVTAAGPPAAFTFDGAPNACTAPVINGIYTEGTPLTSANTIELDVNVTTAGSYTISSAAVNGMSFSGSGILSSGAQTITLTANGTPLSAGASVITPVTGGCSFTINVTPAGGTSVYTLSGAPGSCTTPVLDGTYMTGLPMSSTNIITVLADVTTAGTYSLSTNTVNGITFSGTGNLVVGTAQPIVLTASGTPVAAGTNTFNIGSNGCSFQVTVTSPPQAVYTLEGSPGTCNPLTVNGSYLTGNALTANNTITVDVNVTTAGAYTITTNTVNGMTFSKTGVFTVTGDQSVTLTGTGTPAVVGTNTFTVGTGGCTFTVTVTAPSSPCTGLTDGVFVMEGRFTLNGISFGTSLGSEYQASIQDMPVQVNVFFPGGSIPTAGTYTIPTVSINCLAADFTDWNATSGNVYVSIDGSGNTIIEFCNVPFTGTLLMGGTVTSTGSGKIVL